MTVRKAHDVIIWTPRPPVGVTSRYVHVCPTAVVTYAARRDALDPMALGTCRYCKKPLP